MILNILFCLSSILFAYNANAESVSKAIIGVDNRTSSHDSRVGRMGATPFGGGGCSASLIGKTCMISAGHCLPIMKWIEFNVPNIRKRFGANKSEKQDIYKIDFKSINYIFNGKGHEDWAVFRLNKHKKISTRQRKKIISNHGVELANLYSKFSDGYFPGQIYGHNLVSFRPIKVNDYLRITSYGIKQGIDDKIQQTSFGYVTQTQNLVDLEVFYHDVDTTSGSSGAGIVEAYNDEIVGVATFQECGNSAKRHAVCRNGATSISKSLLLQRAIRECLNWERLNL